MCSSWWKSPKRWEKRKRKLSHSCNFPRLAPTQRSTSASAGSRNGNFCLPKAGLGSAAPQREARLRLPPELPRPAFPARPPGRFGTVRASSLVDPRLTCGPPWPPPGPASACTPSLLHSSDLGPGISGGPKCRVTCKTTQS